MNPDLFHEKVSFYGIMCLLYFLLTKIREKVFEMYFKKSLKYCKLSSEFQNASVLI